ncbi:large ribosomal subunit protein mL38 isoform X1 [Alligator mississippiensis]|uniref:large ribosomal subunit protein mL38 isoform X1 n=2 Tax=Alligator mississippiensis TaxID=8496 RepID=UPI0009072D76|nr:large ribosomal subunit protein mL38 isoform X1 [Alligator mississippiensis]
MILPHAGVGLRDLWRSAFSVIKCDAFNLTALCRRTAPLGPMPNEDIDVSKLDILEKYRSFTLYFKAAEKESKKTPWWRTYKKYITSEQDEDAKINIGLPCYRPTRSQELKMRKEIMKQNRQNVDMERATRLRTLQIPLDEVRAEWEKRSGPFHKQRVAEYYGIYRDLFSGATFAPRVILRVEYSQDDEHVVPVYHGNMVTPTEAYRPPEVMYEADEGTLWTLLLTNLDGHLRDTASEYIHWLVTNIPGNDVGAGKEICHYFPPFPAKGTGYHRFTFLLFKQDRLIDFSEDVRPTPCHSLKMRTFKTFDFYRKHEKDMTPAGLAFFQCQWDDTVTHVFRQLLDMKEPVFDFVRPSVYHPPQKKFPHLQPLRYLDRYRDSDEPTYGIY